MKVSELNERVTVEIFWTDCYCHLHRTRLRCLRVQVCDLLEVEFASIRCYSDFLYFSGLKVEKYGE